MMLDESKALVASVPHWHRRFEICPGLVTPGAYDPPGGEMNVYELANKNIGHFNDISLGSIRIRVVASPFCVTLRGTRCNLGFDQDHRIELDKHDPDGGRGMPRRRSRGR